MTEVAQYEAPAADVPDSSLVAWARDAAAAYQIARSLVKTSFVPTAFRGKPEEATAAILTGAELGLKPLAALRSIDIISGTPALRAMTLRAITQGAGHDVWVVEATNRKATVAGRRKGSDITQERTWTMERAQGLGLTSKPNWQNQPENMLIARATAEVCRLIAADAMLGLYAAEELDDPEPAEPVKRTARRKPLEVVTEQPAAIAAAPALPTVPAELEPDLWPETPPPGGEAS